MVRRFDVLSHIIHVVQDVCGVQFRCPHAIVLDVVEALEDGLLAQKSN